MKIKLLVACVLLGLLAASEGCLLQGKHETLDSKMALSDAVLHGTVLSAEKDSGFPPNVYSVKFEVWCIYKGTPINEIIWIDEVGSPPGHCVTTNLTVGESYLLYLRNAGEGRYIQNHLPDPAGDEYLEEVAALCETRMTHPTGYNKDNSKDKCPEVYDAADCPPNIASEPPKYDLDDQSVSSSYDTVPANPQNPDYSQDNSKDKCTDCPTNTVVVDPPRSKPDDVSMVSSSQRVSSSHYTMPPIHINPVVSDDSTPNTPMVAPSKEDTGDTNTSAALTWNTITLLLVLSTLLL